MKKHSPLAVLGVAAILATSLPGVAHAQGLDPAPPPIGETTEPPTGEIEDPPVTGDIIPELDSTLSRGSLVTAPIDQASIDAHSQDPHSRTATLFGPGTVVAATIANGAIQARIPADAPSGAWTLNLLGPSGEILDSVAFTVSVVEAQMSDATLGADLEFSGSGFVPGSTVNWVIKDAAGAMVRAGETTAGPAPDGVVSGKLALGLVDAYTLGQWSLALTDISGNTSTAKSNVSFDDSKAEAEVTYSAAEDAFLVKISGVRPGSWGSLAAVSGDIDLGGTSLTSKPSTANDDGMLTFLVPVNSTSTPIAPEGSIAILWKVAVKSLDDLGYKSKPLAEGEAETPADLGTIDSQSKSPLFIDKDRNPVTWPETPVEPIEPPVEPEPVDPPVKPVDPPVKPVEPPVDPGPIAPIDPPAKPIPPLPLPPGGGSNGGVAPVIPAPPAVVSPVIPAPLPEVDEAEVQKQEKARKQAEEQIRIDSIFANSSLEANGSQVAIAGAELPRRNGFFENVLGNFNQDELDDTGLPEEQDPNDGDEKPETEESITPAATGDVVPPKSSEDESSATAQVEEASSKSKIGVIALAASLGLAVLGWLIFAWRRKKSENESEYQDEVRFDDAFERDEPVA